MTPCERYANEFDADLYQLIRRAQNYADRYPAAASWWSNAAGHLTKARPFVRHLMTKEDREKTI